MKFVRVLKATIYDDTENKYFIDRDYVIEIPRFPWGFDELKQEKYKQKVLQEMQTCKDVIINEFLSLYNKDYKNEHGIRYDIYRKESNSKKEFLGTIEFTKYKDGKAYLSGNKTTEKQNRFFINRIIEDEQDLSSGINEFLNSIVKETRRERF